MHFCPLPVFHQYLAEFMFTSGRNFLGSVKFQSDLTCSAEAPELKAFSIPYTHKRCLNLMRNYFLKYFYGNSRVFFFVQSYADTAEHIDRMNEMYDFVKGFETKFNGGASANVKKTNFDTYQSFRNCLKYSFLGFPSVVRLLQLHHHGDHHHRARQKHPPSPGVIEFFDDYQAHTIIKFIFPVACSWPPCS